MSRWEQAVEYFLMVGWIPGLILGWTGYRKVRRQPSWRNSVSLILLCVLSSMPIVVVAAVVTQPREWIEHVHWEHAWLRAMPPICAIAFVASFFTRARLILPLALAAVSFCCA